VKRKVSLTASEDLGSATQTKEKEQITEGGVPMACERAINDKGSTFRGFSASFTSSVGGARVLPFHWQLTLTYWLLLLPLLLNEQQSTESINKATVSYPLNQINTTIRAMTQITKPMECEPTDTSR
jgi:hypothetical protein